MSGAQHTPGPWEAINNLVRSPMRRDGDRPAGALLAEVRDGHGTLHSPESTANALLIAAAPELLEVLREIIGDGMHCDVVPHLHSKAVAAISKATGSDA